MNNSMQSLRCGKRGRRGALAAAPGSKYHQFQEKYGSREVDLVKYPYKLVANAAATANATIFTMPGDTFMYLDSLFKACIFGSFLAIILC